MKNIIYSMVTILIMFAVFLVLAPMDHKAFAAGSLYVSTEGNDNNGCFTPSDACATINSAISKASPESIIYIASGLYTGEAGSNQVILVIKNVSLSGGWDQSFTAQNGISTVDGENTRRGIVVNSNITASIDRFAIKRGYAYKGMGIYSEGTLTLDHSAVYENNAAPFFFGLGIYNTGTLTINNSSISNNIGPGSYGGAVYSTGSLRINNSTISDNLASTGTGLYLESGSVSLNNVTISHNSVESVNGTYSTGGIFVLDAIVDIQNTIIASSSGTDCYLGQGVSGSVNSLGYNIVKNNVNCVLDSTDQSTDPKLGFLIGLPGYHPLLLDSPGINAGNPIGCMGSDGLLTTDQRGVPRSDRCDIGAFEYITPGPVAQIYTHSGTPQSALVNHQFLKPLEVGILDAMGNPVNNISITFSAPVTGPSGTFIDTQTTTSMVLSNESGVAVSDIFIANGLPGTYVVTATLDGFATQFEMKNFTGWFVSIDGLDSNDCQSISSACGTIEGVLKKPDFVPGNKVRVEAGLYTSVNSPVATIDKDVLLSGGWDQNFLQQTGYSILDGENQYQVLTVIHSSPMISATLSHFKIQNGYIARNINADGAGVANGGRLALNDCYVTNNRDEDSAGGILNTGSLWLNSCIISNNLGGDQAGGNVTNYGGYLALNNSYVILNMGQDSGGVYNAYGGSVRINSSTISNNMGAVSGGGINNSDGVIVLQNSILSDNQVNGVSNDCTGTLSSAGYNIVSNALNCQFVESTGDRLNLDPQIVFFGNTYIPFPGSPAIDAGNPNGCNDDQGNPLLKDQRGAIRPMDGDNDGSAVCDVGAYEIYPYFIYLPLTISQ